MHLTWQPGDPVIQLDFPNPLNVSVQTGDVAYFSNPINYGTSQNPITGDPWASTTTPHLTSNQDEILMIGEIVEITPWNGVTNSITCNMPQDLFNRYFSQITVPVCTTSPTVTTVNPGTGSGTCSDHIPRFDVDPLEYVSTGVSSGYYETENAVAWFFDNPSVNFQDVSFHAINPNVITPNCPVSSSKTGYDPTKNNYWVVYGYVSMSPNENNIPGQGAFVDINGNPIYLYDSSIPGFTNIVGGGNSVGNLPFSWIANDAVTGVPLSTSGATGNPSNGEGNNFQAFFDWIDLNFPGVTNPSVGYNQYFLDLKTYGIMPPALQAFGKWHLGGTAPGVTVTPGVTTCVGDGSFIMFSKDNKANLSSVLGYYASVTLKNNSQEKAELFNVGADVFESSK